MSFNNNNSHNIPALTVNGIKTILATLSGTTNPSFQPVYQVISIKAVGTTSMGCQRYRIVLSDGQFFVQGMLATQLNSMIEETGELQVNSVIRVLDFMNNAVQTKNVIIVLKLEILGSAPRSALGIRAILKRNPTFHEPNNYNSSNNKMAVVACRPWRHPCTIVTRPTRILLLLQPP
jgi:hypothetical protein